MRKIVGGVAKNEQRCVFLARKRKLRGVIFIPALAGTAFASTFATPLQRRCQKWPVSGPKTSHFEPIFVETITYKAANYHPAAQTLQNSIFEHPNWAQRGPNGTPGFPV